MARYITKNEYEKRFVGAFERLCSSRSSWQVWADLMSAIACSLANAVDKSPEHYEAREKEYTECIKRLGSVDAAANILAIIVEALEADPEQDFLGAMYMRLELGNHWKGQFFTPYNVCRMSADMLISEHAEAEIQQKGFISVNDPTCGGGAMLIAAANTFRRRNIYYHDNVLFVAQDIDRVVGQMCYIQLSLLGCAGYVMIGNSLTNPTCGELLFPHEREGQELWLMPMFFGEVWHRRRQLEQLRTLFATVGPVKKEKQIFIFNFDEEAEHVRRTERKSG